MLPTVLPYLPSLLPTVLPYLPSMLPTVLPYLPWFQGKINLSHTDGYLNYKPHRSSLPLNNTKSFWWKGFMVTQQVSGRYSECKYKKHNDRNIMEAKWYLVSLDLPCITSSLEIQIKPPLVLSRLPCRIHCFLLCPSCDLRTFLYYS